MSGAGGVGGLRSTGEFSVPAIDEDGADTAEAGAPGAEQEGAVSREGPPSEVWDAMQNSTSAALLQSSLADQLAEQECADATVPGDNQAEEVVSTEEQEVLDELADLVEEAGDVPLEDTSLLEDIVCDVEVDTDDVIDELIEVDEEVVDLEDELEHLTESLQTDDLSCVSTSEIKERMNEIQSQLDFLYEYEDLLIEELQSPDTDFFDSFWIEEDLWDVEFDIWDLESELSDLKGEVYEREDEFFTLFSDYGNRVGDFIDVLDSGFDAGAALDMKQADATVNYQIQDMVRQRQQDQQRKIDQATQERGRALAQGLSFPERTDEVRQQLVELRPKVQTLCNTPSREAMQEVRTDLRRISERPTYRDQL